MYLICTRLLKVNALLVIVLFKVIQGFLLVIQHVFNITTRPSECIVWFKSISFVRSSKSIKAL